MKLPKSVIPLLKQAADNLSNNICNDYFIPDTKENRDFLIALHEWNGDGDEFNIEDQVHRGQLFCMDYSILAYIAHLVEKASE